MPLRLKREKVYSILPVRHDVLDSAKDKNSFLIFLNETRVPLETMLTLYRARKTQFRGLIVEVQELPDSVEENWNGFARFVALLKLNKDENGFLVTKLEDVDSGIICQDGIFHLA